MGQLNYAALAAIRHEIRSQGLDYISSETGMDETREQRLHSYNSCSLFLSYLAKLGVHFVGNSYNTSKNCM